MKRLFSFLVVALLISANAIADAHVMAATKKAPIREVPAELSLSVEEAQNYDLSAVREVDGQPVPEGKISYTYKKGGWFGSKSDTLPTQPGEYVQTATVGGNYSCEKITRTIIIQ